MSHVQSTAKDVLDITGNTTGPRVLHAALIMGPEPGIRNQMQAESDAARSLGLPWRTVLHGPYEESSAGVLAPRGRLSTRAPGKIGWLRHHVGWRRAYYRWLQEAAQDADVVMLRHSTQDPFRAQAIHRLNVPVVSVHHTLEVPELQSNDTPVRARLERLWGPHSLDECVGIVGVTREILHYEQSRVRVSKPGYVHPNGTTKPWIQPPDRRRSAVPEILFVAAHFRAWQGLDRLLESVNRCADDFVLHLVGVLGATDEAIARRDGRIKVHGSLGPEAIAELARDSTVGVSSLALDRKGMQEACPIKVREYLQLGLPVYAGHADVFPGNFPWFRMGPAHIGQVLLYATEVADAQPDVVAADARPHIDKGQLLLKLNDWLTDHVIHG